MSRRYSYVESLFIGHQAQLTDYIAVRLPGADQHTVEDLTQETWLRALSEPATRRKGTDAEGLPGWIARAAALAIHHHTTPQAASDRSDDREWLTQLLGPTGSWPEHWHRILADQGQQALLHQVAAEPSPAVPSATELRPAAAAA